MPSLSLITGASLAEALVLCAAVLPLVRLVRTRGFRGRLRALSGINLLLLVLLPAYFATLFLLALFLPIALHLAFPGACILFTYLLWRARPGYGRARGLPPGSLALLPTGQWDDPQYYSKGFDRHGPIFKSSDLYRPSVNILGIERAREMLSQNADALRVPAFAFNRFIPNNMLRFAAPERHAIARPIFQSAISAPVIRDAEPWLADLIRAELGRMASDSREAAAGVHPEPYLQQIVLLSFSRLFFGITPEMPVWSEWQEMLYVIALRRASRVPDALVKQTLAKMMALLQTLVNDENAVPSFLSELKRVHPEGLADPFFIYNLIYMLQVGRSDLAGLLFWILKMLSDHPAWVARARDAGADADVPMRIVRETLRLHQSEFLVRQTTREIRFQEYVIPKGWFIRACISESHRSSAAFENPGEFNPDRFPLQRAARAEYMPFGAFNKSCLGENLTLRVAKIFVQELTRAADWCVLSDGPQEFSGFHWQPGKKFRIRFQPFAL